MSAVLRECSLLLLLYHLCCVNAATDGCNFQALSVPIKMVELSNKAAIRGIALSVGSPPQNIALNPQTGVNHTWLFDEGLCATDQPDGRCFTSRGGLFTESRSSSFHNVTDSINPDAPKDNGTVTAGVFGTDDIALSSNTTLSQFSFGLPRMPWPQWRSAYAPQHALGLASNSTMITALRSGGHIGSRTWSMFWGLAGATQPAQMDGGLVFGGYDAAKVQGKNYTQQLNPSSKCPSGMLVTIRDMVLNYPNGTSPSMFNDALLTACINPDFPSVMTVPYDPYYSNFEAITRTNNVGRSFSYNFYNMLYDPNTVYDGDLTIKFDTGLSIRISNSQLVLPETIINADGSVFINETYREVMIDANTDVNRADTPVIGRQFFTSAYLMVDQQANTFTLWEAEPTTDSRLVTILDDEAKATCRNKSAPVPSPVTESSSAATAAVTPSATGSHKTDSSTSGAMSTGAIVGIAVGGVAAVICVAIVIFLIWKRSKSRSKPVDEQTPLPSDYYINSWSPPPQELPARSTMQELSSRPTLRELPSSSAIARPARRRGSRSQVIEIE